MPRFTMTLSNHGDVTVIYRIQPPDPSVGIMEAFCDDFEVHDCNGREVKLSHAEDQEVQNACDNNIGELEPDYPPEV